MDRPDLSQSAWARARADGRVASLDTLFGLVVVAAFGAAGGALASSPNIQSSSLTVVALTAGTIIGTLLGVTVFVGWHLIGATRRQRNDLRQYIRERELGEQAVADFKARCVEWAYAVEKMLEVQAAKEPLRPKIDIAKYLSGDRKHEPPETTAERESIQRTTVSLYIEQFRDDGVYYFRRLIDAGTIIDKGMPKVAAPKNITEVSEAADFVRTAADRL